MVRLVDVLAAPHDDLNRIPGTNMVEGETPHTIL